MIKAAVSIVRPHWDYVGSYGKAGNGKLWKFADYVLVIRENLWWLSLKVYREKQFIRVVEISWIGTPKTTEPWFRKSQLQHVVAEVLIDLSQRVRSCCVIRLT
jgi:hypothetical protein